MFYESNRFSHAPGYIFMVFSQFLTRRIPLPRHPLHFPGEAGVFEFECAGVPLLHGDMRVTGIDVNMALRTADVEIAVFFPRAFRLCATVGARFQFLNR